MAAFTAREIYRFARLAGFSPDQAVTMTAIALAESGGDPRAHNSSGEDSRGLWQINVAAHGDWAARRDLYDPVENARAAFKVSGGGRDVSPWTTTHGGRAPYLSYRAEALAAARASGDSGDLGVWTGTPGYGHPMPAGGGTGATAGAVTAGIGAPAGGGDTANAGAGGAPGRTFLDSALAQTGDRYVFGAQASASDPNPTAFDCSKLVQWSAHRAGVDLPRRAVDQYLHLKQHGSAISVEQALHTPGALLFRLSPEGRRGSPTNEHVAISLGDGRTIEARGKQYGVGSWAAENRFTHGALIPGISGGTAGTAAVAAPSVAGTVAGAVPGAATDSDHDGLTDGLESRTGLNATVADSDADGLSDGYELMVLQTDARSADTDRDGMHDSMELAAGTDSNDADTDRDGQTDGAQGRPGGTVDTDSDGLTDDLEAILGTDPHAIDSDHDGFIDGAEYQAYYDPADATGNPLAGPGRPAATPAAGSAAKTTAAQPDPHDWGLDLGP